MESGRCALIAAEALGCRHRTSAWSRPFIRENPCQNPGVPPLLAAGAVAPGQNRVVPLPPEFIAPQNGHAKQNYDSRATRPWLSAQATRYAGLRPVHLGDDLFLRRPIGEAAHTVGGHCLFVCEPGSHRAIEDFRAGATWPTRPMR